MVLGEQEAALPIEVGRELLQFAADEVLLEQLLAKPDRDCHRERAIAFRRECNISLEQPLELQKWLLVEHDIVNLVEPDRAFREAIADRMHGKASVVLLAREALLLRCRHDAAVDEKRGGAVVVEGGDAENPHAARARTGCR